MKASFVINPNFGSLLCIGNSGPDPAALDPGEDTVTLESSQTAVEEQKDDVVARPGDTIWIGYANCNRGRTSLLFNVFIEGVELVSEFPLAGGEGERGSLDDGSNDDN
jgi:hypothetical protein